MAEYIRVDTKAIRKVGDSHDEVAQHISTARLAGEDISTSVSDFGPIMWRFRQTLGETLLRRDTALAEHEERHRQASLALFSAADRFESQEELNQAQTQNIGRMDG